jgi:hypothetical protein
VKQFVRFYNSYQQALMHLFPSLNMDYTNFTATPSKYKKKENGKENTGE